MEFFTQKPIQPDSLQENIKNTGRTLFCDAAKNRGDVGTSFLSREIMNWSMSKPELKLALFRFVDLLPSLESNVQIAKHLHEYFVAEPSPLSGFFRWCLRLFLSNRLSRNATVAIVRKNVTQMAKMFITGETPEEAISVLKKQRKNQLTFTVDILGEATLSEVEAKDYLQRYLHLMDELANESSKWNEDPIMDRDHQG